ncbi:MAG: GNAT family N-acetyltransferase [Thomasclavelia ramosa]|nr:GNAT family N-acetyltransferase [Thomasclavelia ramosa]
MIKIIYDPQKDRAAAYDDGKFIGESTYSKSDKLWIIDHTFVEGNYGGQGIATKLVAKLVDEARKGGIKIIPLCPFAKREFELKEEYLDVLSK